MRRFTPSALRHVGCALFEAAGCTPENARTVVDHLVESNLFGHDSHGVIRYPEYLRALREGRYQARARPSVVRESACTAVVDGGAALGPIGATFAIQLAIGKAREHGTASVAVRNTSHIGRVGAYPLIAARQGMMAVAFVNGGKLGYLVAPFGGLDGRLSTNPIAFAAPRRDADPLLLDMTTSVVAAGKIQVAVNEGKPVPASWLIDHAGNPTTDPRVLHAEPPGAMLPLGGPSAAYKGYGLALAVELLSGTLSGEGCAAGAKQLHSNGVLFTVYRIEHFTDLAAYFDELDSLIGHVRTSRPAAGVSEILLPGEPEFRTAHRRERDGIDVDDTTWKQILDEADKLSVRLER